MRLEWVKTYVAAGIISLSANVVAENARIHEQVQVPQCLAEKITNPHLLLAGNKEFKIIDLAAADLESLSLLAHQIHCGGYVNVSHRLNGLMFAEQRQVAETLLREQKTLKALPQEDAIYEVKHQSTVKKALQNVVPDAIQDTLTHMVSFYNRSSLEETGVETAKWLKSTFEAMAVASGRTDTATFFVKTGTHYKQPSLVTVIGKDLKTPAVVIGAHMDTLGGRMPGAGDDGSGSATVMEMARVLLSSQITFDHPVYIIWYAAEERGLVGSQYVVEHFKKKAIPVKAAIQFDMTGYRVHADDPTMWVFTDYTNKSLSRFVAELIHTYVQVPVNYSQCGYGCSDHASWNAIGVPAAFPCESNFEEHNPYIHSVSDTMDLLSLEHMTNFTKLAIAFAIELASN